MLPLHKINQNVHMWETLVESEFESLMLNPYLWSEFTTKPQGPFLYFIGKPYATLFNFQFCYSKNEHVDWQ